MGIEVDVGPLEGLSSAAVRYEDWTYHDRSRISESGEFRDFPRALFVMLSPPQE